MEKARSRRVLRIIGDTQRFISKEQQFKLGLLNSGIETIEWGV